MKALNSYCLSAWRKALSHAIAAASLFVVAVWLGSLVLFARVDFGISSAEGNDGSESTLAGPFPTRQESVVYPRMWTLSRPPAAM